MRSGQFTCWIESLTKFKTIESSTFVGVKFKEDFLQKEWLSYVVLAEDSCIFKVIQTVNLTFHVLRSAQSFLNSSYPSFPDLSS